MIQSPWTQMALIGVAALVVNLPLGYLREGTRKFSFMWFVYIHLSVPLIAFLRTSNQVSAWAIPLIVACTLLGQLAGGRMRRLRRSRP
jgi:predicted MFS family arabinose efflux permease